MKNWAGNYVYRARHVLRPRSIEELQEHVRSSTGIRPLGSRHSFNDVADTTGDHLSLDDLPRRIEIDREAQTVTIDGGLRYGDLCGPLHDAGLALHNLASLPHISVAGACATGTHGSGNHRRSLATAVQALDVVRGDGELMSVNLQDVADSGGVPLDGAVVALGALGVVTRLTLRAEPTFQMRQDVFEHLPIEAFVGRFEDIASIADSVSFFTEWRGGTLDQVWLKTRVRPGSPGAGPDGLFGAVRAPAQRHPIRRLSASACTPQLGVPGPWHERLPHFRMEFTPSAGDELQSEYIVGYEHAVDAFLALDRLRARIAPLVQVSEIRTIAPDDLWLSPAFRRASVAFHFTWLPDWAGVRTVLPFIERAMQPFQPRPHWGKLFAMAPDELRAGYEKLTVFAALAGDMDPTGKFRNAFLRRYLFE
jgi:xylitol oxidase